MKAITRSLIVVGITVSSLFAVSAQAATSSQLAPLLRLPKAVLTTFECVLWHESRSTLSHVNVGDNNASGGSSGIYQITSSLWNEWAPKAGIPSIPRKLHGKRILMHTPVWLASISEQTTVAIYIEQHDGGFWPWGKDGCFNALT